ncbi:MAG TPA: flagellar biosynthetic protein FliR [Burkholderiaceae bacterium]|nr:flagellar biosynthetic protein FliR [Burkholderiaceae bacterium]
MITVSSAELQAWIAGLLWPLSRILGLIMVAPLFSNRSIPMRVRVALGIMIALIVAPTVTNVPAIDPMSVAGILLLAQQMVIGMAMGFAMRLVFAAVEMAGEMTGMTMGLGFATFFDPQSQGRSSAVSQFLALLMLMIYLAANVHLVLLSVLVESFSALPVSPAPLEGEAIRQLVLAGGRIFNLGVQLALPMVAALLMTNMALGILTRAAPQLNLFGIGFPVTLTVGFILIALSLPYLATPMERLLQDGIELVRHLGSMPPAVPAQ